MHSRAFVFAASTFDVGHGVARDLIINVGFMKDWFGLLFWGLIISSLVGLFIAHEAEARRVRRMWAAIASEHGWRFEPGGGKIKGKISGTYQGYTFTLLACINYQQKAPAVYTEVMFAVKNLS